MKVTKKSGEKGIAGVAVCKVGEKNVTFVMKDGEHEDERFPFKISQFPEEFPEDVVLENGKEYFISMNSTGDELRGIRPARGLHSVKVVDFARTQDEDFLVLDKDGQWGKYQQFIPQLEIVSGKYKGIRIPIYITIGNEDSPKMQDDGEGNVTLVGNLEKSKSFAQFFDLWVYGLGEEENVEYDDDIQVLLKNLLKAFLRKKRTFFVLLEKGYVKSMSSDEEQETETTDEDEAEEKEVPKAKKSFKKDDDDEEDIR